MTRLAFAGNRSAVLDLLLDEVGEVAPIWAVEGSWLARDLDDRGIEHRPLRRDSFVDEVADAEFDVLVLNGCPVILPPHLLGRDDRRVVNIHPSALPDLRGRDPIPGALLHGRASGATCHLVDAGIDTGAIISRVELPLADGIDAPVLYQLAFRAEVEVARSALAAGFEPSGPQPVDDDVVTYRTDPDDRIIHLDEDPLAMVRRVRAFANRSQGARLRLGDEEVRVHGAELVDSRYLTDRLDEVADTELVAAVEGRLLFRRGDRFVLFREVEPWNAGLRPGARLDELQRT
ncbi:MAG: formyltransferase family protein [Actinomycetota bacterium]